MAATPDKYEFRTYLESIAQKYQNRSNLYTLTDAVGKQQVDMLLTVKLVPSKQNEKEQEKSERLPVLEGICKYAANHVLLVGKPGSGKSTTLQRLLWEKAITADVIPVLVELRSWQPETGSVIKLIQKIFQRNRLRLNEDEIENLLFDGKLLLLFDGLNELPSDESRRLVGEFRQDYPQTPMIFTTRDLGIGGDLGIEKQLLMQPLTLLQMRAFTLVYLPEQGEEMLRQLNDKLQKFAETPLLLWMLCNVYAQSGKIPRNLGESFRNFTNIYDNKLKADVPGYKNYRDWCRNLLEVLAYQMMSSTTETEFRLNISIRLAEDILTEYLKQENFDKPRDYAKRWLEDLLEHHLISIVHDDKIEFRHQLFQEYYAAGYLQGLLPSLNDNKLKRDYLNLLKWTEPLTLMVALLDNEAPAVKVVQLALDVDLMLGARLAGLVKREFQQKTVDLILEKKLRKKVEIELLGTTRSELVVKYLTNYLKDENLYVCNSAAFALRKIVDKTDFYVIINTFKNEYFDIRISLADALEKIDVKTVDDALMYALKDENPSIRNNAALALSQMGSKKNCDAWIYALRDENLYVNESIASELISNKTSFDDLINILMNAFKHIDSKNREYAASILAKIATDSNLSQMWNILLTEKLEIQYSIAKIQERHKFYNHEIFHSPLVEEANTTNSQNPQYHFHGNVGIVNTGDVNIEGNQLGIQNNQQTQ